MDSPVVRQPLQRLIVKKYNKLRCIAAIGVALLLNASALRAESNEYQNFDANSSYPMKMWTVGAGLVLIGATMPFDQNVRHEIQSKSTLRDSSVARVGNQWGEWGGAAVALSVMGAGKLFAQDSVVATGSLMIQSAFSAGVSARAVKIAAGRVRPEAGGGTEDWGHSGQSFPSGHTSQAFALSTAFAESVPNPSWQRRAVAYSLATTTAYARIYDDKHWLSDTVAGALVGVASALSVIHFNRSHKDWQLVFLTDQSRTPQLGVTVEF